MIKKGKIVKADCQETLKLTKRFSRFSNRYMSTRKSVGPFQADTGEFIMVEQVIRNGE